MSCLHSICVIRDRRSYGGIYRIVNKLLDEGFAVIYAMEEGEFDASKNQFVNRVYLNIRQSSLVKGQEDYIDAGTLLIIDPREIYSTQTVGDTSAVTQKWVSVIKKARRNKFKKIAIIASGTIAFANQRNLVACEQAIMKMAKKLETVQIICCYLKKSLDNMQFAQLASITNAHDCNVIPASSGIESRGMSASIILWAIIEGIEDILGKGSGRLIIQTMKAVYKINEDAIISNPPLFQQKLQKILGNTSDIVLDSINKKIKEAML
jgi:hypothetical protein